MLSQPFDTTEAQAILIEAMRSHRPVETDTIYLNYYDIERRDEDFLAELGRDPTDQDYESAEIQHALDCRGLQEDSTDHKWGVW